MGLRNTLKKKRVEGGSDEKKISKREEWERARRENSAAETIQRTFRRFVVVSVSVNPGGVDGRADAS